MGSAAAVGKKRVGMDLTQGPILKGLLIFTIPLVMTSIIQQLYSIVDMMVIGHFVGSTGTVGVSTGGEISDLVTPVATAFSSAGQIYIAQLVGAKMEEKLKKGVGTLITLMLAMAVVFMFITLLLCNPILRILNCPAEAISQARAYMLITGLGIPFIFGYNAVCGILRGMGESKRPLIFIIIAAVVNIVLDIIFVAIFKLEAAGTAIATVAAQIGSFTAAFAFMYKRKEQFEFELKPGYFKMDKTAVKIIVAQGLPQAIRSLLVRFSLLWVNSNINSYGLVASATNSVGNKIQKALDVFSASMAQAAGAMVGQNLGAKKQDRAAKTVLYTFFCNITISFVMTALALTFPRQLFGIFTSDAEVLDMGVVYMQIIIWHFICSAVTTAFQSMVIGSGYAAMNFMIGILDGVICKVGFSILFADVLNMGVLGYFWAIAVSRALPGLICIIFFFSGRWRNRRLLSER